MDGQLQNIRSELSGFFSNPTSGPTTGHTEGTITGGSFAFDEDTLRSLVTDWLNLADNYRGSKETASRMVQVEGAGLDFASEAHAIAANKSGQSYRSYLTHNEDYCTQQAQLFQNALDDYLGIEHRNVAHINKSGGPQAGI
jgi:hypothetical protein